MPQPFCTNGSPASRSQPAISCWDCGAKRSWERVWPAHQSVQGKNICEDVTANLSAHSMSHPELGSFSPTGIGRGFGQPINESRYLSHIKNVCRHDCSYVGGICSSMHPRLVLGICAQECLLSSHTYANHMHACMCFAGSSKVYSAVGHQKQTTIIPQTHKKQCRNHCHFVAAEHVRHL